MRIRVDRGTKDGVDVGIIGYLRYQTAAILEGTVDVASEASSEMQTWYVATVEPGDVVIFNVGGLPVDEVLDYSDTISSQAPSAPSTTKDQPSGQSEKSELADFVTRLYRAYKGGQWQRMGELASDPARASDCFDYLVASAELVAGMDSVKDAVFAWSEGDSVDAGQIVKIAVSILASSQGKTQPESADLSVAQKESCFGVWKTLYVIAVETVGRPGESIQTDKIEMIVDKLESALEISSLVHDPVRLMWSTIGRAWLEERTGNHANAQRLLELAASVAEVEVGELPWPPIAESGVKVPLEE
ncbi:MAG: hypothetical protein JXA87_06975 [Thermoleophilia bacterium]|nr:hypothetical protein [Thermoleophilia bacterium]